MHSETSELREHSLGSDMAEIRILDEMARWRTRKVQYLAGAWTQLERVIPKFELSDFHDGPNEPANPFLRSVVRLPINKAERRIPVGVVSNNYMLVQHAEVGNRCLSGMAKAGVDLSQVRCEMGLSELGEWMHLRLRFPDGYCFQPKDNHKLDLRVEAFNSVDRSSRLIVLLSWLRLVCLNKMVVRESLVEVRDLHNSTLDLSKIEEAVGEGTRKAKEDKARLTVWGNREVHSEELREWADDIVADLWGKNAACRVFHICASSYDVEPEPFSKGRPSEKAAQRLDPVPGAASPAINLYDVCQALSWVATKRNNPEERIDRQAQIPDLIKKLNSRRAAASRHPFPA
jgi:hypothetical protein